MVDHEDMVRSSLNPAFYARRGGRLADWWTLLHPPYTLWHLAYPVIGATLAPRLDWVALVATIVAFFLAVGLAAHALDELNGRPLRTAIPDRVLWVVVGVSVGGAVALGVAGVVRGRLILVPFIIIGVAALFGYNLELCGGRLHTDLGFAVAWGGFPVVVGYLAQGPPPSLAGAVGVLAAAASAVALSLAQRRLSTPARTIRRRLREVTGAATLTDGTELVLDRATLLAPLESALRAMSYAVPLLAAALGLARAAA